jgi:hypothetical protein
VNSEIADTSRRPVDDGTFDKRTNSDPCAAYGLTHQGQDEKTEISPDRRTCRDTRAIRSAVAT